MEGIDDRLDVRAERTILHVSLPDNLKTTIGFHSSGQVFPNINSNFWAKPVSGPDFGMPNTIRHEHVSFKERGNPTLILKLPERERPKDFHGNLIGQAEEKTADLLFNGFSGKLNQVTHLKRGTIHTEEKMPYPTIVRYDNYTGEKIGSAEYRDGQPAAQIQAAAPKPQRKIDPEFFYTRDAILNQAPIEIPSTENHTARPKRKIHPEHFYSCNADMNEVPRIGRMCELRWKLSLKKSKLRQTLLRLAK